MVMTGVPYPVLATQVGVKGTGAPVVGHTVKAQKGPAYVDEDIIITGVHFHQVTPPPFTVTWVLSTGSYGRYTVAYSAGKYIVLAV